MLHLEELDDDNIWDVTELKVFHAENPSSRSCRRVR